MRTGAPQSFMQTPDRDIERSTGTLLLKNLTCTASLIPLTRLHGPQRMPPRQAVQACAFIFLGSRHLYGVHVDWHVEIIDGTQHSEPAFDFAHQPPFSKANHATRNPSMDASSALSTLSALTRTPSPVSRYHTADEGTSSRGEDVTDISSPGEAADEDHGVQTPYRDALDLPRELRLRCQIHLEEQYCRWR